MKAKAITLFFSLIFLCFLSGKNLLAQKLNVSGVIKEKNTHLPMPGATVRLQGDKTIASSTDVEGNFVLKGLKKGVYNIEVSFISFKTQIVKNVNAGNRFIVVEMEPENTNLSGVTISAKRKTNTDVALINTIKKAEVVVSGISAQQISRSQDKDASEVVRRIPGVTIIGNRFILVRGLSERYNAVQLNDATAPSMEADVRSFSFDIIPSSLIDRILINKSPSADLPGDFAGGAVKIYTKSIPEKNLLEFSYGTGYRFGSALKNFYGQEHNGLHWTGFNEGKYDFPENFPSDLSKASSQEVELAGKALPNAWIPVKSNSGLNQGFGVTGAFKFKTGNVQIGNITSVSYGNSKTIFDIERKDFSSYDNVNQKSVLLQAFSDKQYTQNIKFSVLHNWAFQFNPKHIITLRNLFNQYSQSQYVERFGYEYGSGDADYKEVYSFYNIYRGIYSGQLNGTHTLAKEKLNLDWALGYGYSYRDEPDYRRYTIQENATIYLPISVYPWSLGRFFSSMKENIYSANANAAYKFKITPGVDIASTIKTGVFYEYKDRSFLPRNMGYTRSAGIGNNLNSFMHLPIEQLFKPENINNKDGIVLEEATSKEDAYNATNSLMGAYVSFVANITNRLSIIVGARAEYNVQKLNTFTGHHLVNNSKVTILPSLNTTYSFSDKNLLRLAYGLTVNRPEFREVSPFSFYDFNYNFVKRGNVDLKDANIHNFDMRYEYYPSPSEIVSGGIFYKYFITPIENLVVVGSSGNAKSFECQNITASHSYGIELEIRKSLAGLTNAKLVDNISVILNGSIIRSKINLDEEKEKYQSSARPMQGQSPFIVNAGLQYKNEPLNLQLNVMYNVIGKRIFAVGYKEFPDIYEMPRHLLDLTITKGIGKYFEIKVGANDLLNNHNILLQDGNQDGKFDVEKDQVIQKNISGTTITFGISYKPFN